MGGLAVTRRLVQTGLRRRWWPHCWPGSGAAGAAGAQPPLRCTGEAFAPGWPACVWAPSPSASGAGSCPDVLVDGEPPAWSRGWWHPLCGLTALPPPVPETAKAGCVLERTHWARQLPSSLVSQTHTGFCLKDEEPPQSQRNIGVSSPLAPGSQTEEDPPHPSICPTAVSPAPSASPGCWLSGRDSWGTFPFFHYFCVVFYRNLKRSPSS